MATPAFIESLEELRSVLTASTVLAPVVTTVGEAILASLRQGGKLLTCGNGGSAADALHLAEELVGRYKIERRALPAICLNSDVTALTCIGNDYGYDAIFARQVEALGRRGDVLVGFTTSGNSANVLAAFAAARARGITTVLLSGKDGGKARTQCDYPIIVPSATTARIQEVHTLVLHQWLEAIDAADWTQLPA
ncbi:MAG: D-sedoheptulose 7-phosphate isomerase [Opitutus sp.]|nr:D-sedoheptulose 7-phosphate isomerase [Opitutus sp.]MCS6247056.1 D-sedoheptulose 7-phosphate isomerase [Opitutus sp.]MCS6273130.1 D-sedoheptulose 7-phosphate isomerase [Opitutus sp.]MCS6278922.1 D-sedoheptulose 7-phosphate isomerase [Opitutus sp.]MCS6298672.1 D-sedoheptulose 7-phosphate isomerase [Opitutus sp.]